MDRVIAGPLSSSMIIGITGLINSGKDTAAELLVREYEFRRMSFASPLKDLVAIIFGWDRTMLEGTTPAARAWRDQVDPWWAARLNIPDLTPRLMLQRWGTEVGRQAFHREIWIASLENRLRNSSSNVVISDCRFPDEMRAIRALGGRVIRIQRGIDPAWLISALAANQGDPNAFLEVQHIHESERAWIGQPLDATLRNDGSIAELHATIRQWYASAVDDVHRDHSQ